LESKNLRKAHYIFIFIFAGGIAFAQRDSIKQPISGKDGPDRFRGNIDITLSMISYKLTGVTDKGDGTMTVIGNHEVVKEPVYRYGKKRVIGANVKLRVGLNIPFYRGPDWSTGIRTNIGIGYQYGVLTDAEISSGVFDIPQYVYFRYYKGDHDFTISAGWNYNLSKISNGMFIMAFDLNLSNRSALRFYCSPIRKVYYSQLSNGELKPALKVSEFGISLIF
jgi:hypothetical protein